MALDDDVALAFLGYLLLPIVVLLILWLVWWIRRLTKKDKDGDAGAEAEG